jgi:hypothetical protein
MTESIIVTIKVSVANGPNLMISQTVNADAYDKIDVLVPNGSTKMSIELQPNSTGKVKFLLLSCDQYSDKLTYTVNAAGSTYKLDGPYLLSGAGAVDLLDPAPTSLVLTNSSGQDAQVGILIGRDVTS